METIRENLRRTERGERLTVKMLEQELAECRQLFGATTDRKRLFQIHLHIAALEAGIKYKRNHPIK